MELDQLMEFARAYGKLGSSVQAQFNDVVDGDLSDINPNALVEINQRMKGFNDDLDGIINRAVAELEVQV